VLNQPRGLCFAEQQIHDPAAADMLARLPAVVQDVGIIAAGVFEGVGEDGQAVEGAVIVDALCQSDGVSCSPRKIRVGGTKRIAGNVAEDASKTTGTSLKASR
jgi:hypothetical protein